MPKVLQINATANWGSTGRIAEQINNVAREKGWETYIAYGRYANHSDSHLIRVGCLWDVYEHYFENLLFDNEGLASRRATKRLIKTIKEISPDIIHLHNIHDHWINYKLLFEYLNVVKIPVVWTQHDCWAFTGHCHYYDIVNCQKWKQLCASCPMNKLGIDRSTRNFKLKESLFNSNNNLVITPVSTWLSEQFKNSILKDKEIIVIHNGIDINVFKPGDRQHSDTYNILGVSNEWSERKGLADFIKLSDMLPSNVKVTIVGLTKSQIKMLPKNIKGLERTGSIQELVDLYSNADVFVNPTYSDTFPTVNLEALACGTPVITYRTGGSPEAIDEETGIVVEQGDFIGLTDAVTRLISNPLSREKCRSRAERYFDKNKCFEKYLELYDKLLNS